MQSLGQAHLSNDDLEEAENLFRQSITMHEALLPEDDVNRAMPMMGLGRTMMKKGDFNAAEKSLMSAFELRRKYLPAGHELVGVSQQALGECSLAKKNYTSTIVFLEAALASLQKYPEKYKTELSTILHDLEDACRKNNLPKKANHYQTLLANL
jgi:tetratricopeptide (TPR) repeat protein